MVNSTNQAQHMFVEEFVTEVHNNASVIDPSEEQDWYSLTLGWAIGKGLPIEDARALALYIRYHTPYG